MTISRNKREGKYVGKFAGFGHFRAHGFSGLNKQLRYKGGTA